MASGDDGDYGQGQGLIYNKYIGPHVREEIWASTVRILAQASARGERVGSDPMPGHSAIIKALQGVAALHAVRSADKAGAAQLTKAASEMFAAAGKELMSK
jgi:hypothetical protein